MRIFSLMVFLLNLLELDKPENSRNGGVCLFLKKTYQLKKGVTLNQ